MSALIARLRAAREFWVELEGSKAVKLRRPAEAEIGDFIRVQDGKRSLVADLDHVKKYAVDWKDITEADLLGEGVGVSDPVPFDAGVWAEVVADNMAWLQRSANGLVEAIVKHLETQAEAAKNLPAA